MRNAASVNQLLQVSSEPRGARTTRAVSIRVGAFMKGRRRECRNYPLNRERRKYERWPADEFGVRYCKSRAMRMPTRALRVSLGAARRYDERA
jgi:hypothetical protein